MGWLSKRGKEDTGKASRNHTPPAQAPHTHPILDGLPENWRGAVFATGRLRKFGIGDLVEDPAADAHYLCLVLKGRVAQVVATDGVDTVEATHEGGHLWIQPQNAGGGIIATLAQTPVTVLLLDPEGLHTLPDEHQLTIHRELARQARTQANDLFLRHAQAAGQGRRGRTVIARLVERHQRLTADSEMVTKVIHSVPRLPAYATQLIGMLAEENTSVADMTELAQHDPSLAAEVMKTINSPYFALPNKVADLQHAMVMLGFDQLHQLVIANGMAVTMPKTPAFSELLLKANAVSFIGLEIAKKSGFNKPVMMSTIGLLHALGNSMTLLLKGQFKNLEPFIDMLDPATMGARLLRAWSLPEVICEAVSLQDNPHYLPPQDLPDRSRKEVAALYLARLSYDVLKGKDPERLPTAYLDDYLKLLRLPNLTLAELVAGPVLTTLRSNRHKLPEHIRRFFSAGEARLVRA